MVYVYNSTKIQGTNLESEMEKRCNIPIFEMQTFDLYGWNYITLSMFIFEYVCFCGCGFKKIRFKKSMIRCG
jgi:hypothetical protein